MQDNVHCSLARGCKWQEMKFLMVWKSVPPWLVGCRSPVEVYFLPSLAFTFATQLLVRRPYSANVLSSPLPPAKRASTQTAGSRLARLPTANRRGRRRGRGGRGGVRQRSSSPSTSDRGEREREREREQPMRGRKWGLSLIILLLRRQQSLPAWFCLLRCCTLAHSSEEPSRGAKSYLSLWLRLWLCQRRCRCSGSSSSGGGGGGGGKRSCYFGCHALRSARLRFVSEWVCKRPMVGRSLVRPYLLLLLLSWLFLSCLPSFFLSYFGKLLQSRSKAKEDPKRASRTEKKKEREKKKPRHGHGWWRNAPRTIIAMRNAKIYSSMMMMPKAAKIVHCTVHCR